MRVEIGIIFADAPLTDQDALHMYRTNVGETGLDGPAGPGPHLKPFMADLTARYPCLDSLREAERENSPWAREPKACGEHAKISLGGHESASALEFVMELAEKHGLVCFDPKTRSILTAPPGIHVEQQADRAVWPLTLATLSLALVSVLWLH